MTFDPAKPVRFRGEGLPTPRIVCTDAPGGSPVIAVYVNEYGETQISTHQSDGRLGSCAEDDDSDGYDLINVELEYLWTLGGWGAWLNESAHEDAPLDWIFTGKTRPVRED